MPNSPIFTGIEGKPLMVCRLQNVRNGWVGKKVEFFIEMMVEWNEKKQAFSGYKINLTTERRIH